jgi:hypothetical protein
MYKKKIKKLKEKFNPLNIRPASTKKKNDEKNIEYKIILNLLLKYDNYYLVSSFGIAILC